MVSASVAYFWQLFLWWTLPVSFHATFMIHIQPSYLLTSVHSCSQAGSSLTLRPHSCPHPQHRTVSQPGPVFCIWGYVCLRAGGGILWGAPALMLKIACNITKAHGERRCRLLALRCWLPGIIGLSLSTYLHWMPLMTLSRCQWDIDFSHHRWDLEVLPLPWAGDQGVLMEGKTVGVDDQGQAAGARPERGWLLLRGWHAMGWGGTTGLKGTFLWIWVLFPTLTSGAMGSSFIKWDYFILTHSQAVCISIFVFLNY